MHRCCCALPRRAVTGQHIPQKGAFPVQARKQAGVHHTFLKLDINFHKLFWIFRKNTSGAHKNYHVCTVCRAKRSNKKLFFFKLFSIKVIIMVMLSIIIIISTIIVMSIWVVAGGGVCVQPKWINRWLIHTDQSSIVITGVIMTYDHHHHDILTTLFSSRACSHFISTIFGLASNIRPNI